MGENMSIEIPIDIERTEFQVPQSRWSSESRTAHRERSEKFPLFPLFLRDNKKNL